MIRLLVFAYSGVGQKCLEFLLQRGECVVGLVTHMPNEGEFLWFTPPASLAQANGIPIFTPDNPNHPDVVTQLKKLKPDIIFSFYYRKIICDEILQIASLGAFNMHGSLLPHYRGCSPVNWAILKGETRTGITLHRMIKRIDGGDIVGQLPILIRPNDTAGDVMNKIIPKSVRLLQDTLELIKQGQALAFPQDVTKGSYFGIRRLNDAIIQWHEPASDIYNLIRSQLPYPICYGAITFHKGNALRILKSHIKRMPSLSSYQEGGTIFAINPLQVTTGTRGEIIEIQEYSWIEEPSELKKGDRFTKGTM